jgi:hypothetical protein
MIFWLLVLLALAGVSVADAQDSVAQDTRVLELPTVTLVGEDTLFLEAPAPQPVGALPRPVLALRRGVLPEQATPRLPSGPAPVEGRFPSLTPNPAPDATDESPFEESPAGPLSETEAPSPQPRTSALRETASSPDRAWRFRTYYVPGRLFRSGAQGVRALGPWDTALDLDLALADGWVSLAPEVPTFLLGRLEARRSGPSARVDAGGTGDAVGGGAGDAGGTGGSGKGTPRTGLPVSLRLSGSAGAFLPPSSAYRYALSFAEDLALRLRSFTLTHATDASGLSPGGPERVGLLGQRLTVDAYPGRFTVHAGAEAYLRGTLQPDTGRAEGLLRLGAGYRSPGGAVTVAAGASGLYRDGTLDVYPEGEIDFSPCDAVLFRIGAGAFLNGSGALDPPGTADAASLWLAFGAGGEVIPLLPLGLLYEGNVRELLDAYTLGSQALTDTVSTPLLEPQSGYAVRSRVIVAAANRLRAQLAAELLFGSVYEGWGGTLTFGPVARLAALAELSIWLLRFGTPESGLEVSTRGFAAVGVPPPKPLLEAMYGQRLEGEVRLAFPNRPLRIIMGVLWGEIPTGLPGAALLVPWEPFNGLAVSLSADLRFSRRHVVRLGCEMRLPDGTDRPDLRFVAGYRYE